MTPLPLKVSARIPDARWQPKNRGISRLCRRNCQTPLVGARVGMRRLMLSMSQQKLGGALGLTFQQVQKYEKGINRIGASRLQHISHTLQVPVSFFFEGAPRPAGAPVGNGASPSPNYVSDFLATSDGLALTKAFMLIKEPALRRRIVHLVQEIAASDD
jgi:transcriptional regulator with XRE-family HTH domain